MMRARGAPIALALAGARARALRRGDRRGRADRLGSRGRTPGLGRAPGAGCTRARTSAAVRARTRGRGHRRCTHGRATAASSTSPSCGAGAAGRRRTRPARRRSARSHRAAGGARRRRRRPGAAEPGRAPAKKLRAAAVVPHVQVIAVEYHFTLSRTTVPAGKVVLQFVNNGQDEHNLNVLSGEGELEAAFPKTVSQGRPRTDDEPAQRQLHAVLLAARTRGERDARDVDRAVGTRGWARCRDPGPDARARCAPGVPGSRGGLARGSSGILDGAMSQQNVELVASVIDRWNSGEWFVPDAYDLELEWLPHRSVTEGAYRGIEGIKRFAEDTREMFERFELRYELIDLGEQRCSAGARCASVQGRAGSSRRSRSAGSSLCATGRSCAGRTSGPRRRRSRRPRGLVAGV